ncbi:MAG: ATP-binding cassette domain-containing protein, partial [Clostridia bacterium]|nr:ATP-binding cassette domain-containing protein [Clostridia bacterium]
MSYLSLQHVSKQYHIGDITVNALNDVSFDLDDGEFAVVLGSSGAGKTTLLNLLGGMDDATEGEIILDGKNVTGLTKRRLTEYRRNDVGFVFQFYNLMPNLTALENVEIAVE